jgi:UDP-3-O-[3-hydroxymyristoyl] N-acetylglucosamine deacetylase
MANSAVFFQKTLKNKIIFSGIGVHSGKPGRVTVYPAVANTGLVLRAASCPDKAIKVGTFVPEVAMHATVVKADGWAISTIEHLMASLWMMGVDNAVVEFEGYEVPILDGSALPFVQAIQDAGLEVLDQKRRFLTPKAPLTLADGKGRSVIITPPASVVATGIVTAAEAEHLMVDYTADFNHPLAGKPIFQAAVTTDLFVREIAPARTFGFLEQLPFLRQHKLAQGTCLGNTVVIGQEVLNELRFADEPVRHKVLDLLGDMSLIGNRLVGAVTASKTSHSFNRMVVEHLVQHPDQWMFVEGA